MAPKDTARLRRRVLDASIELVAEQGVRAVSFREVARRAGVSHQTPYHHFGNHRGILRAIAEEGFATLCREMNDAADAAGEDARDRLVESGTAYVGFAAAHPGYFRVMFQHNLVDIRDPDDPLTEAEATYATLVRLSDEAHGAGYGHGMSGDTIAKLCWSTVHGLATLITEGALSNKQEMNDAAIADLTDRVVRGLGKLLGPARRDGSPD